MELVAEVDGRVAVLWPWTDPVDKVVPPTVEVVLLEKMTVWVVFKDGTVVIEAVATALVMLVTETEVETATEVAVVDAAPAGTDKVTPAAPQSPAARVKAS